MKHQYVNRIVKEIDGILKYGNPTNIVEDIATMNSYIDDNTLIFHIRNWDEIDWNKCKEHINVTVVTEMKYVPGNKIENINLIIVDDIDKAYDKFIKFYRGLFKLPVITVTGTCGKTTTKEMIWHILKKYYNVTATYLSSNATSRNLPYMLSIDDETDVAVFETGVAYYPGDLLNSCKYFKPEIGIITNIGADHLRACETLENYILAKGEMLQGLDNKGTLILNGDDENIKKIDLSPYKGNIIYFGKSEICDFKFKDIRHERNGIEFTLLFHSLNFKVYLPGVGEHNIYNALAAIAATHTLGIGIKDAIDKLKGYEYISSHTEVLNGTNDSTIIDDTWSSNPTSCKSAIKSLKEIANGRKTIAVLGKMSLLGQYEEKYHKDIGKYCVDMEIDILVTMGEVADIIGREAIKIGMNSDNVYILYKSEDAIDIIKRILNKDTVLLLKASMLDDGLDRLIDEIVG